MEGQMKYNAYNVVDNNQYNSVKKLYCKKFI